ncbi:DUF2612 domain-containing protein [Pasteurellaceae bacterium 22721_9_1]
MDGLDENYLEIAKQHNLIQFQCSPNIHSLYTALFTPFASLQGAFRELLLNRHLDNAVGKQLDGIGDILGLSRPYMTVDGVFYFGFTGQSKAKGFSQAVIRSLNSETSNKQYRFISDNLYKRLLRWKIVKNNSHGTVEDVIRACQAAFVANRVEVIEEKCKLTVNVTRSVKFESEAIESIKEKLIPAAAGIFVSVNIMNGNG